MAIYMNYNNIPGDVTESGHTGWIELNSFQFGVGRGIAAAVGSNADRESSEPSVSEIVVTKDGDTASVKLLTEAYQGDGVTVEIDFTRTNAGKLLTYAKYVLTNTMISGFSLSSGGDRPSESISLNFTKIATTFTPMDATGTAGNPETITYDLGLAKTM